MVADITVNIGIDDGIVVNIGPSEMEVNMVLAPQGVVQGGGHVIKDSSQTFQNQPNLRFLRAAKVTNNIPEKTTDVSIDAVQHKQIVIPPNPATCYEGDEWLDPTTLRVYKVYFDGQKKVWVETGSAVGGSDVILTTQNTALFDSNKTPDSEGFAYRAGNTYVTFVNPDSPIEQFQTEAIYRCKINAFPGESPESHPSKWVYQGDQVSYTNSGLSRLFFGNENAIKSIVGYGNGNNVVNLEDYKIYSYDSAATEGLQPNDNDSSQGRWVQVGVMGAGSSHFKGQYTSLANLEAAHPTAEAGDYAIVDEGEGFDAVKYIWDITDTKWVQSGGSGGLTPEQEIIINNAEAHINGADEAKHGANQISVMATSFDGNLNPSINTVQKLAQAVDDLTLSGGDEIPPVSSGEKVVTKTSSAVLVNKDLIESEVAAATLDALPWAGATQVATGQKGQRAYGAQYFYECIGTNLWVRSSLSERRLEVYLPATNDLSGIKTSVDLDALYPTAQVGQRSWGTTFALYEKQGVGQWKALPYTFNPIPIISLIATEDRTSEIPATFAIDTILIENTTANDVTVKIGTTSGGEEVVAAVLSAGNTLIEATVIKRFFSKTLNRTLYISSADWNSGSLTIKVTTKKVY